MVALVKRHVTYGRFGAVLLLAGGLLMVVGAFAPGAQASPHGPANGWAHHHATSTSVAPTSVATTSVPGPYDPFGVGLPSGNGNDNGNATGKPCAGCAGNADDKNPPGQLPGGGDHNNGYECDGNHGVGRTNPAHSGCDPGTTTTTEPATTTTVPVTTTTEATTSTIVETTTTTGPLAVLGEEFTRGDSLARTGSAQLDAIFALGLLLAAAGATLVTAARRRLIGVAAPR